jgi:hypothetical protein
MTSAPSAASAIWPADGRQQLVAHLRAPAVHERDPFVEHERRDIPAGTCEHEQMLADFGHTNVTRRTRLLSAERES